MHQVHVKAAIVYCPPCAAMGCARATKNASVHTGPLAGTFVLAVIGEI